MTVWLECVSANKRKMAYTLGTAGGAATADSLVQLVDMTTGATSHFYWWRITGVGILFFLLTWVLLSTLDYQASNRSIESSSAQTIGAPEETSFWQRKWLLPTVGFVGPLLSWVILFLRYWPMASMNDTYWILRDPLGAAIQHPLAYNIFIKLLTATGAKLGGSELVGLVFAAVVQMLMWAGAICFVIWYFQRLGVARWALSIFIVYCILLPVVGNYSFALVKDCYFSLFVLLLVPVLIQIWRSRGDILMSSWGFAGSAIVLIGFSVMRNNGLMALAVLLPLIIYYCSASRRRSIIFAVFVLVFSLLPMQFTSIAVGKQKFVESVGIPLQMIGAAAAQNDEWIEDAQSCIPTDSQEYFDELFPLALWAETYNPKTVDATKDAADFNRDFLQETKAEFLVNWAKTVISCPEVTIKAYLVHTSNLWRLDADAINQEGQSFFTAAVSNFPANVEDLRAEYVDRGLGNKSLLSSQITAAVDGYVKAINSVTPGAGAWLWMMLLSLVGYLYRRRGEWVAIYLPSILIWLTLLAAAPVTTPFRYVEFIVLVVPLGWTVLGGIQRVQRRQRTVE